MNQFNNWKQSFEKPCVSRKFVCVEYLQKYLSVESNEPEFSQALTCFICVCALLSQDPIEMQQKHNSSLHHYQNIHLLEC